ncbi:MAG: ShlB/FhaC/HecB family hemolysin secretion/activation protein [Phenylobacterium sp.]|uniref:ShlB/FhaC/HecB family hemolysin secretion/activation protein n=1 Tax=Phenylobacterium sp. TaxID=1871053 RepID=UPI001A62834A|nr:ShlB/FhaC/HecB family hemolysin secretion/activation protein [Phenylobacterium sp.]MBL8770674.1 ShlB/FhaC/HecB family hemolysin secretion/activation protein [Phenylobacterium sp.]
MAVSLGAAGPEPATTGPGAAPAGGRFVLTGLTVDGVTAYPLKDLAPLYDDYLAREVTTEDLVKIAQAITDKYRADGYFLTRAVVPPQGPGGHARLRVYEGYIGDVEVSGDAAPALEALLSGLTERRPLRLTDLERRLTLASDLPGVQPRSRIEPVIDDPARHRLVVAAGLRKWSGSVYLDNRGTDSVGPVQATGRLARNSLARPGDQLALSVLTVPDDPGEFVQGELSYGVALPAGSRLRGAFSASRSRQGSTPLNNNVGTESQAASLRLAHPLVRGRRESLWAAVTLDGRHVEQAYRNGGRYSDDLRVVRASLQGDRGTGASSTSVFAQTSHGLEILGATVRPSRDNSRFDADGSFWKLNVGASHYRDIGRRAGLYLAADGQWSPDRLLLSEEFAPGGLPYGRAYNYAEISGDSGLAGLAELRYGFAPEKSAVSFFQTYAFVDGAKVWNHRTPFGGRSAAFSSAGAGMRVTLRGRFTVRVEAARPLTRTPFEEGDKDWRGFASLYAWF